MTETIFIFYRESNLMWVVQEHDNGGYSLREKEFNHKSEALKYAKSFNVSIEIFNQI
jgi:hypothetical protein